MLIFKLLYFIIISIIFVILSFYFFIVYFRILHMLNILSNEYSTNPFPELLYTIFYIIVFYILTGLYGLRLILFVFFIYSVLIWICLTKQYLTYKNKHLSLHPFCFFNFSLIIISVFIHIVVSILVLL